MCQLEDTLQGSQLRASLLGGGVTRFIEAKSPVLIMGVTNSVDVLRDTLHCSLVRIVARDYQNATVSLKVRGRAGLVGKSKTPRPNNNATELRTRVFQISLCYCQAYPTPCYRSQYKVQLNSRSSRQVSAEAHDQKSQIPN